MLVHMSQALCKMWMITQINETKYLAARSLKSNEEDRPPGYFNVVINYKVLRERKCKSTTGSLPI